MFSSSSRDLSCQRNKKGNFHFDFLLKTLKITFSELNAAGGKKKKKKRRRKKGEKRKEKNGVLDEFSIRRFPCLDVVLTALSFCSWCRWRLAKACAQPEATQTN